MAIEENAFREHGEAYARARPRYPDALFDWLASQAPARDVAWDCATGSGQAALGLARRFRSVEATDVSAEQIAHAAPIANVRYRVAPAEDCGLPDRSVDAIAVAQALHWLDHGRFYSEARRVARPGAFLCAWGYAWMACDGVIDRLLLAPYRELLAPFWSPRNRILWDGYAREDVALPFEPVACPPLEIAVDWTVDAILDYMSTWSAFRRSRGDPRVVEATDAVARAARAAVPADEVLRVRMPIVAIAARLPG